MESMSWSAETRCLYCDGKLPLFRKLASGQFCSAAHSKAYWKEQERLALERLHQTHDSLRAYQPPGALEAILGPGAADNPYYRVDVAATSEDLEIAALTPPVVAAKVSPLIEDPIIPQPSVAEEIARRASNSDQVAKPGFLAYEHPAIPPNLYLTFPRLIDEAWAPLSPFMPALGAPELSTSVGTAGLLHLAGVEHTAHSLPTAAPVAGGEIPWALATAAPLTQIVLAVLPDTPELALPLPLETAAHEPEVALETETVEAALVSAAAVEVPARDTSLAELEAIVALPSPPTEGVSASVDVAPVAEVSATPVEAEPAAAHAEEPVQDTQPPIAGSLELPLSGPIHVPPTLRAALGALEPPIPSRWARFETSTADRTERSFVDAWASSSIECGAMLRLPCFAPRSAATPAGIATGAGYQPEAEPNLNFALAQVAMPPTLAWRGAPRESGFVQLPAGVEQSLVRNRRPGSRTVEPSPMTLAAVSGSPEWGLDTEGLASQWKLASGIRYPIAPRNQLVTIARPGLEPVSSVRLPIELPCDSVAPVLEPSAAWLLSVPFQPATPCPPPEFTPGRRGMARIDASGSEPNIPASRLEAVQGTLEPQSRFGFFASAARSAAGALETEYAWAQAVDFWRNAPRDLKLLLFAIPALLALALHPSMPKFRMIKPANVATEAPSGINAAVKERFLNVRQTVANRAGVELTEDFRAGLDSWQSRGDLSAAWSFDTTGFVRPGMLALYQPSMNLKDYDMSFLGLIDKKALSFVVRAQDFDNYYVIKIVILKPGPLPTLGITRYAVIDGKPSDRQDVIAPINARPDMLYRVGLSVHDDTYLLQIQSKIVDSWSEARLTHGGVGFFSAHGEDSRLRWVQVTHQYDMLGRLCAYLAPYNTSTRGSW